MTADELVQILVEKTVDDRDPRQVCMGAGATVLVIDTDDEHAATAVYDYSYGDDSVRPAHIPKWMWDLCHVLTPRVSDYHGDVAVIYS